MAFELWAEELRYASQRNIGSVISSDGQCQTTNEGILREFRGYHQKPFTGELGLSSALCEAYFIDFPYLEATEAAGY